MNSGRDRVRGKPKRRVLARTDIYPRAHTTAPQKPEAFAPDPVNPMDQLVLSNYAPDSICISIPSNYQEIPFADTRPTELPPVGVNVVGLGATCCRGLKSQPCPLIPDQLPPQFRFWQLIARSSNSDVCTNYNIPAF